MEENNKLSEEEIENIIKTEYSSKDDKTKEFIRRSLRVHGDLYGYDKSVYINTSTKVTIYCNVHGYFEQLPNSHYSGAGCRKCADQRNSESRRSSTEEFIKKAREMHKDKYDYSKVNYVNNSTKVTITCLLHGDFEQYPSSHLAGHGCPECAGHPRYNTESFIKKAKEIYKDEYEYDQVNYVDSITPVKIYCKKHGYFEQRPVLFLQGYGCPKCGNERKGDYHRGTKEDFVKKAEELYPNNEYGYEKVNYINNHTPIIIIDHLHNDEEFSMMPYVFLAGSQNPRYKSDRIRQKRSMGAEEFIRRAKEIHEDDYDYSEVEYVNSNTKVKIYCPRCGEYFYQTPANHLKGEGCPHCISYRMSRGERFISSWLNKNNIEYIHGQIVSGVEGRMLNLVKPDFQLTIDSINYWIEYNGELHYEYTPYFHSDIGVFEAQLKRDRNVREYCRNNDITLIEIPYIFNTFERVCDFLTQVLINKVDPNTIINYKELYKLTEDISFGIDDLLL